MTRKKLTNFIFKKLIQLAINKTKHILNTYGERKVKICSINIADTEIKKNLFDNYIIHLFYNSPISWCTGNIKRIVI